MTRQSKTHELAQCSDCNWSFCGITEKGNANEKAKAHSKKHNHNVVLERGFYIHYDLGKGRRGVQR